MGREELERTRGREQKSVKEKEEVAGRAVAAEQRAKEVEIEAREREKRRCPRLANHVFLSNSDSAEV
eukprot:3052921-Rhodomonas_salina.1